VGRTTLLPTPAMMVQENDHRVTAGLRGLGCRTAKPKPPEGGFTGGLGVLGWGTSRMTLRHSIQFNVARMLAQLPGVRYCAAATYGSYQCAAWIAGIDMEVSFSRHQMRAARIDRVKKVPSREPGNGSLLKERAARSPPAQLELERNLTRNRGGRRAVTRR
jgi:hypothetical protein